MKLCLFPTRQYAFKKQLLLICVMVNIVTHPLTRKFRCLYTWTEGLTFNSIPVRHMLWLVYISRMYRHHATQLTVLHSITTVKAALYRTFADRRGFLIMSLLQSNLALYVHDKQHYVCSENSLYFAISKQPYRWRWTTARQWHAVVMTIFTCLFYTESAYDGMKWQ